MQKGGKEIEEVEVGDNKGMTKEQREKTARDILSVINNKGKASFGNR